MSTTETTTEYAVTGDDGEWITGTADQCARALLGTHGEPHPELLADTVREVEYHGRRVERVRYSCTLPGACRQGTGTRALALWSAGGYGDWVEPRPVCSCGVTMMCVSL